VELGNPESKPQEMGGTGIGIAAGMVWNRLDQFGQWHGAWLGGFCLKSRVREKAGARIVGDRLLASPNCLPFGRFSSNGSEGNLQAEGG